ncbi:MAG: hypothetical protein ACFCD0_16495 [Gemmataceae bacterium]
MTAQPNDNMTPLERSSSLITAILDDLRESYTHVGGGGIGSIKQDATWVYTVSILQEERIDLITYTLSMKPDGTVVVEDRATSTQSFDH